MKRREREAVALLALLFELGFTVSMFILLAISVLREQPYYMAFAATMLLLDAIHDLSRADR